MPAQLEELEDYVLQQKQLEENINLNDELKLKIFTKFVDLAKNQIDLAPEYVKFVNDNFSDLLLK